MFQNNLTISGKEGEKLTNKTKTRINYLFFEQTLRFSKIDSLSNMGGGQLGVVILVSPTQTTIFVF